MNESAYYVWCPLTGAPRVRHADLESARAESRRLCEDPLNRGREFIVLRAIESVQYRIDPYLVRNFSKGG